MKGRLHTAGRILACLTLLAAVAGCAMMEGAPEPESYYSHDRALQLLHEGRVRQARALVIERLDANPRDADARDLLRQIESPPEVFLGEDHFIHEVERGETLSMLAERYLGDADRFFILARYNDIESPQRLRAGQDLRIPTRFADAPEPADPAAEAPRAAERAVARGKAALAAGDRVAAATAFARALEHDPEHALARAELDRLRDSVVPELHREAVLLYRNHALDPAIELWDRALAIDPDFDRARDYRSRAMELRSRLDEVEP